MNDDTSWSTTWVGNTGGTASLQSWDGNGTTGNTFTITNAPLLTSGDTLEVTWQVDTLEPTLHACLVCDEKQEHQICKVCVLAVSQYRDELFLKQIKDLL